MGDRVTSVRISARVLRYLQGTQAWEQPEKDPEAGAVMDKIKAAPSRKDDSVTVKLDLADREILCDYAEWLADAASSDAGWDKDALADLNSGRALARKLRETF